MMRYYFKPKQFLGILILISTVLGCSLSGTDTDNTEAPPTHNPTTFTFNVTGGNAILVNNAPIEVSSLTLPVTRLTQGKDPVLATVTLTAAPPEDLTILVGTSSTVATKYLIVPDTVIVPAGQTSVTFPVSVTNQYGINPGESPYQTVFAKAYEAGQSRFYDVRVEANLITSFYIDNSPTAVTAGTSAKIIINRCCQVTTTGGETLTITSSDPNVVVTPTTALIERWATPAQTSFTIQAQAVTVDTLVTLTATEPDGNYRRFTFTVVPNGLTTITMANDPMVFQSTNAATVTLAQPAPAGGAEIKLDSSHIQIIEPGVNLPTSVVIPEGQTSTTFNFSSYPGTEGRNIGIAASYNGTIQRKVIFIRANSVKAISLDQASVLAGQNVLATVTLEGTAKPGGEIVSIGYNGNYAISDSFALVNSLQNNMLPIPEGQASATFSIQTNRYTSPSSNFTVIASQGGVTRSTSLAVNQNTVSTFVFEPASIVGGNATTGIVTLAQNAVVETRIILGVTGSSPNGIVTFPTEVIIPIGQKAVNVTFQTQQQTTDRTVTIGAAVNWTPPGVGGTYQNKTASLEVKKQGTVLPTSTPTLPPLTSTATVAPTRTPTTIAPTPTKALLAISTATATSTKISLASLAFNPPSAKSGATVNLVVTLTGPAPAQGTKITFTTNNAAIKPPVATTIAAKATSVTLAIKLPTVAAKTTLTITGTDGTTAKTASITISP